MTLDLKHAKSIVGYCDPLSVHPGDTVRFYVSCFEPGNYRAQLVRTICGDVYPMGGGFREDELPSAIDGEYPGRLQKVPIGSLVEIPYVPRPNSWTFGCWVHPTTPWIGEQGILVLGDLWIGLNESGCLTTRLQGEECRLETPMPARRWTWIEVSADATERCVRLHQTVQPLSPLEAVGRTSTTQTTTLEQTFESSAPALLRIADGRFNGRLEAPRLVGAALDSAQLDDLAPEDPRVLGWWDFALEIPSDRIVDLSRHRRHGRTVQQPSRAVTGHLWRGDVFSWQEAPEQYAAIHFHEDDLADAGWQSDFELEIPADLPSGLYAARLRHGPHEDHIQFFVRPPEGQKQADLLFLLPTATYLAYANHTVHLRPSALAGEPPPEPLANDATLLAHPELGLSHYDYHRDASGVMYSSRHRPVMNLKSRNVPWSFVADTRIGAWLERNGIAFDVATDEDLHAEGQELLDRYRAVVTGTHPEYTSTAMFDALEGYLAGGGRLFYLGGNGFYWRVAFHPERPGIMEVRRAEGGTRAWISQPGESYHAFTGEYGGLWRRLGRPPNTLVGVGFAAQGFGQTTGYHRTDASDDPRVAFLFAGIHEDPSDRDPGTDERALGAHGRLDSPAGEEIDRYDLELGSPPHALVVASATEHDPSMLRTIEELHMSEPHLPDPEVRADLVFFECPNGGAVLSTGSINWAAALAHNGGDNDVARLTRNAIERFLDPAPFEMPEE